MNKFLWVDVETTGLDPKINTVHQVAGQIVIDGKVVEEFNLEMAPHPGATIEEAALKVSNLTNADVMGRDLSSREAYTMFDTLLCKYVDKFNKKDKYVLCAYNAGFDSQFLAEWYNKNGNKFFFGLCHGGAYFDPLQLALLVEMKAKKRLFTPNRKLGTVAKALGVKLDKAHDALEDIKATREVAYKLWGMLLNNE